MKSWIQARILEKRVVEGEVSRDSRMALKFCGPNN